MLNTHIMFSESEIFGTCGICIFSNKDILTNKKLNCFKVNNGFRDNAVQNNNCAPCCFPIRFSSPWWQPSATQECDVTLRHVGVAKD